MKARVLKLRQILRRLEELRVEANRKLGESHDKFHDIVQEACIHNVSFNPSGSNSQKMYAIGIVNCRIEAAKYLELDNELKVLKTLKRDFKKQIKLYDKLEDIKNKDYKATRLLSESTDHLTDKEKVELFEADTQDEMKEIESWNL